MNLLRGQTVSLHNRIEVGTDPFGSPMYDYVIEDVDNVLISPTSDTDIVNDIQMYGKASIYTLCIPKGDTHDWEDTIVEFFGKEWITFGPVIEYQEELVPLQWNKKIKVRRNE